MSTPRTDMQHIQDAQAEPAATDLSPQGEEIIAAIARVLEDLPPYRREAGRSGRYSKAETAEKDRVEAHRALLAQCPALVRQLEATSCARIDFLNRRIYAAQARETALNSDLFAIRDKLRQAVTDQQTERQAQHRVATTLMELALLTGQALSLPFPEYGVQNYKPTVATIGAFTITIDGVHMSLKVETRLGHNQLLKEPVEITLGYSHGGVTVLKEWMALRGTLALDTQLQLTDFTPSSLEPVLPSADVPSVALIGLSHFVRNLPSSQASDRVYPYQKKSSENRF